MNNLFDDINSLGVNNYTANQQPVYKAAPQGNFDNHYIPATAMPNAPMAIIPQDHEYKLDIRKMLFVETPGHEDTYHRNHTMHLGHQEMRSLEEMTFLGSNVESNVIAPVAGAIIQPSAIPTPNAVALPGGMRNRHLRFMLTIHFGGNLSNKSKTQYVFGYCEFLDYGQLVPGQLNLPLDMRMYFNHNLVVENSSYQGMSNMAITDNSQYLRGDYDTSMLGTSEVPCTLRPNDVMRRLQAIESGYGEDNDIVDVRQSFSYNSIVKNNRVNNNSADYLSRSLKALTAAVNMSGGDLFNAATVHKRAVGAVPEGVINEDIFMKALEATTSISEHGYVTWGELRKVGLVDLDSFSQLKTFQHLQRQGNQMHQQGNLHNYGVYQLGSAMPWTSRTPGAQIATKISQQLPGIMLECGIGQVEFVSTNKTINRQFVTTINPHSLMSFINGGCPPNLMQRFITRLEATILASVTHGGDIDVDLNVFIAMDNDSRIFITVGGMDQEYYVGAQYCDALNSPIWTGNSSSVESMAVGLSSLFNTITRNGDAHPTRF